MGSTVGDFFEDVGSGIVSVGEGIGSVAVDTVEFVSDPTNIIKVIEDPIGAIEDLADYADGVVKDVTGGYGLSDLMEDVGEGLDDAFSKDGIFTRFVEDYVPAGGYFTAVAHAAAGNEDHARVAALKGSATAISAAASIGGGIIGGPMGAAAGGALGATMSTLIEGAAHELVPPELAHRFDALSAEGLLVNASVGALMGGRANARATSSVLKAAAKEGVEDISQGALKQSVARYLVQKTMTKSVLVRAGTDQAKNLAEDIDIPQFTQAEALELMTRQAFEDRMMAAALQRGEVADDDPHDFYESYHEDLGSFWMRDGVVVWDKGDADAMETMSRLVDKGFESVEEYRDEMENSYGIVGREGNLTEPWTFRDNDILGEFMVRQDGTIAWGADTEEEAEQAIIDQELERLGFDSPEEYREEMVRSYAMAAEYAAENGNEDTDWQYRDNEVLGEFMVKDGNIVWGATNGGEAEERYVLQELSEQGFYSVAAYKERMTFDRREDYNRQVEEDRNLTDPDWNQYEDDLLGPYMVKEGTIVWGATTPDEAEAGLEEALAAEGAHYAPIDTAFDPDTPPETGGGYVVDEPDDGTPLDIQGSKDDADEQPGDDFDAPAPTTELIDVEAPQTGGPLIVDEPDNGAPIDVQAPQTGGPLIVDEPDTGAPIDVQAPPATAPAAPAAPVGIPDDFDEVSPPQTGGPLIVDEPDGTPVDVQAPTAGAVKEALGDDWDATPTTPPPPAGPEPEHDIGESRRGESGEDVRELQEALRAAGINTGPADGVFGPLTEAAVRRFQEANDLPTDGIAGPETIEALLDEPDETAPPAPSSDPLGLDSVPTAADPAAADPEPTPEYGTGFDADGDGIPDAWTPPESPDFPEPGDEPELSIDGLEPEVQELVFSTSDEEMPAADDAGHDQDEPL